MSRIARRCLALLLPALLVAALVGSALWAAGCGSSQDASALLMDAVDKTSALQSMQADFLLQGFQGEKNTQTPLLSLTGSMAVDLTTNALEVSSTLPVLGTPLALRVVDGSMYLNISNKWMSNPESLLGSLGLPLVRQSLPTFGELFQLMRYFSSVKKLGSQTVDGTDCDHLAVKLDYSKIAGADQFPAILQGLAGGAQAAGEALQNSHLIIEAWVARDSGLLKEALFSFNVDLPKLPVLSMFLPEGPAGFQLAVQLRNYNEPVQVEVPQDAKPASPNSIPGLNL